MLRRKTSPLQKSLQPGEVVHSIHRARDVGMLNAECSVMFTSERLAWVLDVRPTVVLDAPYERFHGIGVNWDTLELAAEIVNPPLQIDGHVVSPASPTSFLALWWSEPVDRQALEHALTYVSKRTAECPERGNDVMTKVIEHCRSMRG